MKKVNALSLFDGISTARLALEGAGFSVDNYYASEIDKHAITVSNSNYSDIKHFGDIKGWKNWDIDWKSIDFLFAGFSCQSFSICGKQLGFNDERGELFFVAVDILNHIKSKSPDIRFLFENTRMKEEYSRVISEKCKQTPILIDSSLCSAQKRIRNYWCNWEACQPKDQKKRLINIMHETVNPNYDISYLKIKTEKPLYLLNKKSKAGKVGFYGSDSQGNRIYNPLDKSITLCANSGGLGGKTGLYIMGCVESDNNGDKYSSGSVKGYVRKLSPMEAERLQGLPKEWTRAVSDNQRYTQLGNGWCLPVIVHLLTQIK